MAISAVIQCCFSLLLSFPARTVFRSWELHCSLHRGAATRYNLYFRAERRLHFEAARYSPLLLHCTNNAMKISVFLFFCFLLGLQLTLHDFCSCALVFFFVFPHCHVTWCYAHWWYYARIATVIYMTWSFCLSNKNCFFPPLSFMGELLS